MSYRGQNPAMRLVDCPTLLETSNYSKQVLSEKSYSLNSGTNFNTKTPASIVPVYTIRV